MSIVKKVVDVIIIGAGSGGLEAAWNCATDHKKTVAVIDSQKEHGPPAYAALGGTCVNVGCVPKKLMVIGAGMRETFRDAPGFGYDMKQPFDVAHSWTKLIEAKNKTISDINKSYLTGMFEDSVPGLTFHEGWGRFADKNTVEVVDSKDGSTVKEILEGKTILVATGGWPSFPDTPGLKENSISSNEIFYLKELPSRILVVGGGFIAVEFASVFRSFTTPDCKVTLSYRSELFLRGFDKDARECLADQMKHRGIDVRFNSNVKKVEAGENGVKKVTFAENESQVEEYDLIVTATGRHPNTQRLQLDKIGLSTEKDGSIKVDKFNKTSIDNIYAIGDVTNRIQLTPVAIHEADCFAETVGGNPTAVDHENVPGAIFGIPQIGTVGLTEEVAAKRYKTVAVYSAKSTPLMHQLTGNEWKKATFKIVADHSNGKVLGVHICAPEAGEMVQGFAVAVKAGATVKHFTSTIGVHPTSAEDLVQMKTPSYFYVDGERQEKLTASL